MLRYNPFENMILPEGTTVLFPAVSLRDQIRTAMDTGVVMAAVPVSIAYDDDPSDYDPMSDIHMSRLDAFELGSMEAAERKSASKPNPITGVSADVAVDASELPAPASTTTTES